MFPTKLVDHHEKICTIFGIIILKNVYTFVCSSYVFQNAVIHIGDFHEKMSELIVVLKESVMLRSSSTPLHAPVADTFYWISCANAVKRTGAENPKDPQADLNLQAEIGYLLA